MSQKSRFLQILNKRRLKIQENIEKFETEMARYQSRLNNLRDNLDLASVELALYGLPNNRSLQTPL
jgi:hypothetical protein